MLDKKIINYRKERALLALTRRKLYSKALRAWSLITGASSDSGGGNGEQLPSFTSFLLKSLKRLQTTTTASRSKVSSTLTTDVVSHTVFQQGDTDHPPTRLKFA